MTFPDEEIVVLDLAGESARIRSTNSAKENQLKNLGFVGDDDDLVLHLDCAEARIELARKFIELDALFSIGQGWSPAELIEHYREHGLVFGSYRTISWKNPELYLISAR